jgi:lysozyme
VNLDRFRDQLELHEGLRLLLYTDTTGHATIGIGRNLTDKGITLDEAYYLLAGDMDAVEMECVLAFPWWKRMDEVRQRVVADMCFNLGLTKLKMFAGTLRAIQEGRYEEAAAGMLRTKWATQVGKRAQRLAKMMETGEDYVE